MAWILEKVRDTTRLGCRAMSGTALRYAASSGNSTYASSTRNVTRGSASAIHASTSLHGVSVPVGLLGLQMKTSAGPPPLPAACRMRSTSCAQSARSGTVTRRRPATRA